MLAVTPFAVQSKKSSPRILLRKKTNLFQYSNQFAGLSFISEGLSVLKGV